MAIMKEARTLRETAGGTLSTKIEAGTLVEVMDDRTLPWTKIKVIATGQEGWVSDEAIAKNSNVLGPLNRDEVAWECVDLADVFDINAFYLMAVAQLRSNVGGKALAGEPYIGPIGFSPAEWALNAVQAEWALKFSTEEINQWRAQMWVFATMASTRQRALAQKLSRQPNMAELLFSQMLGTTAAGTAILNPTTSLDELVSQALDTADAEKIDVTTFDVRDKALLSADGKTSLDLIAAERQKALEVSRAAVRSEVDKVLARASVSFGPAQPVARFNSNSPRIPAGRGNMADLVAKSFAMAGFGAVQQIAAIANAIAESGLNPENENLTGGERSFGLFQLNQNGGVGTGFSEGELKDPRRNIAIMLGEIAKRYQNDNRMRFMATTSLHEAVKIFVFHFEKPKDKAGDTAKRFEIAQTLVA